MAPDAYDHPSTLQDMIQQFSEGQAAIQELELLKPVLALVIAKYADGEVEISLTEQAQLGDVYALQVRANERGAIQLRAVEL